MYQCGGCEKREVVTARLRDVPASVMPGSKVYLFPKETDDVS